jgi:hypothetical protein
MSLDGGSSVRASSLVVWLRRRLHRPRAARPVRADALRGAPRVEAARTRRWAERTLAIARELHPDDVGVRRRELVLAALLSTEEVARRVEARQRRLARRPLH